MDFQRGGVGSGGPLQVAVRHDADKLVFFRDRQHADVMLLEQLDGLLHGIIFIDRDNIFTHPIGD
jgi:hypothetical protein